MGEAVVRVRAVVHGRVQMVGFRAFVLQHAGDAGLSGTVRNQPDGSVETVFEGPSAEVERMLELVRQRIDLRRDQRLLRTIKGIGVKSALGLLASVPELGRIDNKAAAALIGVAPFVRKSGTMSAPARIHGGRAAVRSILYMAAVTASRHNPVLCPFYERLIAKGKPPKLALIAVLRRLVVFANAVLRSGQPWRGASAT